MMIERFPSWPQYPIAIRQVRLNNIRAKMNHSIITVYARRLVTAGLPAR